MDKNLLQKGINLGGWLSQFKEYDHEHFRSFIKKADIYSLAEWGFDHIRLPVDYVVLEDDLLPGTYLQSGFDYITTCFEWCQEAGLRVILDLHKAPGYAFDTQVENTFERNSAMHQRFINLWKEITEKLSFISQDLLAFELLNEINFISSEAWNGILDKTICEIRSIDANRLILFGGNYYSSVDHLAELEVFNDNELLYKFHFYLPISVTHQKAYWNPGLYKFDRIVNYPGNAVGLGAFLDENPEYKQRLEEDINVEFNINYLRKRLQPAVDFSKKNNQLLHCGEFGVIDKASLKTRQDWTRDIVSLFHEFNIGYAYWSYKEMDFGLVDIDGNIFDKKLINILVN